MKIALASALVFSSAMAYDGHGHHEHHHHGHGHHAHHGQLMEEHPYQNKPHSHVAYHHVEQACARDVENFCTAPTARNPLMIPNLEWAFPSDRELMEIAHTMDHMIESFFNMPPSPSHFGTITIYTPEMIHKNPKRATVHDFNFVADSTASELASQTKPEELPQLAKQLNTYGEKLMASSEEGKPDHHIGRRLTEMDAETLHSHLSLPFGSHKNACLMKMLPHVSSECQRSVKDLQNISYLEYKLEENQASQVMYMFMYLGLLMIFLALVIKKTRMDVGKQRLGHKILEAIYANKDLKRQVEREMGQSVGAQAPVPRSGRQWKEQLESMRRMRVVFMIAICYAFLFAPLMILPICVVVMLVRVIHMCAIVNNPDGDEEEEEEEDDLKKPLMQEYTPPKVGQGQKHTFESEKAVFNGVSVTIV